MVERISPTPLGSTQWTPDVQEGGPCKAHDIILQLTMILGPFSTTDIIQVSIYIGEVLETLTSRLVNSTNSFIT